MSKPVTQEDVSGCGVACVAFVCNRSYGYVKSRHFRGIGSPTKGYFCRDIVKALARSGRRYAFKRARKGERFTNGTIIFVKRSERYPAGHYLVKTSKGYMNPWSNFPEIRSPRSGFTARLPGVPSYAVYPAGAHKMYKKHAR
ncbi:MAG: hypothetical protein KGH69_03320 [Candidatus Micrarchaeota archaeon]|nr:hypothetical protein [Candidatus Micrarchaeota archaeon]